MAQPRHQFSNVEFANMHYIYGECRGNALAARRLYQERYPGRPVPHTVTFTRVHQRLMETGSFTPRNHDRGRPRDVANAHEDEVLQLIEESPGTSTRRIGLQTGLSATTSWRILKRHSLHPYHLQKVQGLLPADFNPRVEFCRNILRRLDGNINFARNVLFTDEACFTRNGIPNIHNSHLWTEANPHAIVEAHHQHTFSLNVWAGIVGDVLVGPHFLPRRVGGAEYLDLLENHLGNLLEDVPLAIRQNMWYLHDGAPPHFTRQVRNWLNENFPRHWIGRGQDAPVAWPARSPDLNACDFFLWGHLKDVVYSEPIATIEELENRIREACDEIRNSPGIFRRVQNNFARRLRACVNAGGAHFEQLL